MAFIGVAACLVDRFGRVPLLLASNAGIAFSQALLPTAYYLLPCPIWSLKRPLGTYSSKPVNPWIWTGRSTDQYSSTSDHHSG